MTLKADAEPVSLQGWLQRLEEKGVNLYLDGIPSTTETILKNCVNEDTGYMPDYVTDECGIIMEARYDRIS